MRPRFDRSILDAADRDALAEHIRDMKRRGLRPPTLRNREMRVLDLATHLAPRTLLQATTADIEQWLDAQVNRGLSQATRVSYTANIRSFYGWLARRGYLTEDPTREIPLPRRPHARPRPIPEADLELALTTADQRMRAWLVLGSYCGLRAMEIHQVRREDILDHLDPPILDIPEGKGGRPRKVPLPAEVLAELAPHMTGRRGRLWALDQQPDRPGYHVSILVNAHLRQLGIPHTCHSLRHRYGTRIYQLSRDLRLTQELLGHSSPATTQIYTQFSQDHAAAVVAHLGSLLGPRRGPLS
ncbi:tyrosine-type recombinase/integrase [Pseudonocardia halophobica]|nr:tyrosine-type recombinase/integrase [Pseudonocardia halophobica]